MTRGRLFATLCSLASPVNLGRTGFAPLPEPLMAAFAVGPGRPDRSRRRTGSAPRPRASRSAVC